MSIWAGSKRILCGCFLVKRSLAVRLAEVLRVCLIYAPSYRAWRFYKRRLLPRLLLFVVEPQVPEELDRNVRQRLDSFGRHGHHVARMGLVDARLVLENKFYRGFTGGV